MGAMPRAVRRPHGDRRACRSESRHPPDPSGTRGIARMARSYGCADTVLFLRPRYITSITPQARRAPALPVGWLV